MAEPKPNPHRLVTCPYDKLHQVEHYTLQRHLVKCQKQHPNSKKVTCPFDATHVVDDFKLRTHIATCPKSHLFDNQKYVFEDVVSPVVRVHKSPPEVHTEENWDDDNVTSYQPDPSKKGSHIITKIKGATPSERRRHRLEGIRNYRPQNPTE